MLSKPRRAPLKKLTDKVRTTEALAQHLAQSKVKRLETKNPFDRKSLPPVGQVAAEITPVLQAARTELKIFSTDPPKGSARGPTHSRKPHPVEARLLQANQKRGDVVSAEHRTWAHAGTASKLSLAELAALSIHHAQPDGPRDKGTLKGMMDDIADIQHELNLLARAPGATPQITLAAHEKIAKRLTERLGLIDVKMVAVEEFHALDTALSSLIAHTHQPIVVAAMDQARLRACKARLADVQDGLTVPKLAAQTAEVVLHLKAVAPQKHASFKAALVEPLEERLSNMHIGTLSKTDVASLCKALVVLSPVASSVIALVCTEILRSAKPGESLCDSISLDVQLALRSAYQLDHGKKHNQPELSKIAQLLPQRISARFEGLLFVGGHAIATATVLDIFRKQLAEEQLCVPLIRGVLACQTGRAPADMIADLKLVSSARNGPQAVLPAVVRACGEGILKRLTTISPVASRAEMLEIVALLRALAPNDEVGEKLALVYLKSHLKELESTPPCSNADISEIITLLKQFSRGRWEKAAVGFLNEQLTRMSSPPDATRLHLLLNNLCQMTSAKGESYAEEGLNRCFDSGDSDLLLIDTDLQLLNTCLSNVPALPKSIMGSVCWTLQERIDKAASKPTQLQVKTLFDLVSTHINLADRADDLRGAMLQIFLKHPSDLMGQTELQSLTGDLAHVLTLVKDIDQLPIDWGKRLGSVNKLGYRELPSHFLKLVDAVVDAEKALGSNTLPLLNQLIALHVKAPALHVFPNPNPNDPDFPCSRMALTPGIDLNTIFESEPLCQEVLFGGPAGMGPAKPQKGSGFGGELAGRYGEYMHGDGAQSGKNRLTVGYIQASGTFVLVIEPPSNSSSGHSQKSHQMTAYDTIQSFKKDQGFGGKGAFVVVDSPLRLYLGWRGIADI